MDNPPPRLVEFPSNPIAGLVHAGREDVRENSSRFAHQDLALLTLLASHQAEQSGCVSGQRTHYRSV